MQITDLKVLEITRRLEQRPQLGGGGIEGSFAGAEGLVFLSEIEVDEFYEPEISYTVYDENGERDAFNDPLISFSGFTYAVNIEGRYFIIIEQMLEGAADPTDGSLNFTIQLTNAQEEIGLQNTVSLVVPNNEETVQEESTQPTVTHEKRNHGQNITYPGEPLTITLPGDGARQPDPPSPPGADTSCCSGTMSCCESPGAGCRQPVSQIPVTRVGDSDLEVEETTESTAGFPEITSEDEYLGITTLDEPSSIEETEESKAVTEEEYLGIETKEEESKAVTEEESKAVTEEEYLGIEEDTPSI